MRSNRIHSNHLKKQAFFFKKLTGISNFFLLARARVSRLFSETPAFEKKKLSNKIYLGSNKYNIAG